MDRNFQVAKIGKTILKLAEAIGEKISAPQEQASERVLKAMQQLVEIIAELRDPAGGWPSDIPQTPENITPYVLEEVSEVLDALNKDAENKLATGRAIGENPVPKELENSEFVLVEDLIPRVLWYAVRSSYHAMRLISGVPAQLFSEQGSSSGTIRLVAGLAGFFPDGRWFIDLATREVSSYKEAIAPKSFRSALIESRELSLKKPVKLETLAAKLRQQIQKTNPEAARLMEARTALCLQPGRLWQKGSIQFAIDFDFFAEPIAEIEAEPIAEIAAEPIAEIAAETIAESIAEIAAESIAEIAAEIEATSEISSGRKTALPIGTVFRVEPSVALDRYCQENLRQQLATAVSQIQENFGKSFSPDSPELIPQLVAMATDVAVRVEKSWLNRENLMDEAIHRLLWLVVRSSYDLMQLVAGVKARVLQPEREWVEGTVRLLAIFEAKTANMVWELDLSTGVAPEVGTILDREAMVRSPEIELCQQLVSVENILADSIARIRETSPAVELFLNGTGVALLAPGQSWQSGFAQLNLVLEIIPDPV
ncbi:MAG: hypothetical protein F6J93_39250 [Oscillatoria sp. SIO1A7]|nr:hypothetical protein [Oscillatoria sp. SIO1A7]